MPRPCCLHPTAIVEAGSAECCCFQARQSPLNGACQRKADKLELIIGFIPLREKRADTFRHTNLHHQRFVNFWPDYVVM